MADMFLIAFIGFGTCLANPKAAVFAMSFLPQFVPSGRNIPLTLVLLAVVWVLVDTLRSAGGVRRRYHR
jgi:threonine/homoserine/homoserine lactone efflux protein